MAPLSCSAWEHDQRLGVCSLDAHGELVARAVHPARQDELEELLHIEFVVQKKHARKANRSYDAASFLTDLPHIFRDVYTAQPMQDLAPHIPARFTFQRLDPATIPVLPRENRSHA